MKKIMSFTLILFLELILVPSGTHSGEYQKGAVISFDNKDSITHTWSLYEKEAKTSDLVERWGQT